MIKKIIFFMIAVAFFTILFSIGIKKNEIVQCEKLARYAVQFEDFHYTAWQKEMCNIK